MNCVFPDWVKQNYESHYKEDLLFTHAEIPEDKNVHNKANLSVKLWLNG